MDDVLDPKKKQSFWMCTLKKILPSGDQKWQLEISYERFHSKINIIFPYNCLKSI